MKKKIFGGIAALAIAAVVALNVQMGMSERNQLSDLSMANVEALAQNENTDKSGYKYSGTLTISNGKGGTVDIPYTECGGYGDIDCP